ncbi:ZIP family metal transporter [Congregibacter litoralis]|uniref:Putative divalent heavy-metal cations transporter n=1 Tax=Congregibacter litoralis KT71 TaxID=314285 RepID=A4A642_9GAMM|nr:ZIP family metal transporter [Congregibacter litoralis]EAQ98489.1 putative divalent heavy-metal cations transporter [Congregibacter litoralis KT71]
MSPMMLLAVYGAALVVSSVAGGALTQRVAMTHTRAQLAMSLVSGLMLGIAFFHLLPHAVLTLGIHHGLTTVMSWTMGGLIVMLLLLRILHFHQPDYPAEAIAVCEHGHDHGHKHGAAETGVPAAREVTSVMAPGVSWRGVLIGLTFHTFIDGVALGAALLSAPHGHQQQLLGFGVFLAILLHKPLDAMSIVALMKASGTTASSQTRANLLFAFVCPLGALLFYFYAMGLGGSGELVIASALAFSAGAFVCIALSDLLPEVQFHSHDRVKLTAVFLLGIALAFMMANTAAKHSHAIASLSPV